MTRLHHDPTLLGFNPYQGVMMRGNSEPQSSYSDDAVIDYLAEHLPNWYFENGWIRRKYKTHSWKGTLMVANTVAHLAEAAFHHPDMALSYAFVIVKLKNHEAKGITDKDFALASKIEQVIMWQPGLEDSSSLPGTPKDPRFAYLKYDNKTSC